MLINDIENSSDYQLQVCDIGYAPKDILFEHATLQRQQIRYNMEETGTLFDL